MKKTFFLLIAAAIMCASCTSSDKCKCTIKVGDLTLSNQTVTRPEDKKCSELKVKDIEGEIVDIDLSSLASISCVNAE